MTELWDEQYRPRVQQWMHFSEKAAQFEAQSWLRPVSLPSSCTRMRLLHWICKRQSAVVKYLQRCRVQSVSTLCASREPEIAQCGGEGEGWMCSSGMETSVSGYRIIISLQSPSTKTALLHTTHTTASSWNNMLGPHGLRCFCSTHSQVCSHLETHRSGL